ncbi:hypothetical protein B9479_007056 [Cryptococcus floricola]|uniref:Uncharacterized protein n=1 Tax=Cryptococcus floricola TaxID=2591691 RepID=A0A5D3ANH0_9TREE|nr:hypothetical protein B9479_007056 [Cryptococcus floricola]
MGGDELGKYSMERLPTPSLLIHTLPQPLISSRSPAFAALCPLRPPHRPTVPHLLLLLRFLAVSSRQFSEGSQDEEEVVVEHSWKRHGGRRRRWVKTLESQHAFTRSSQSTTSSLSSLKQTDDYCRSEGDLG